MRQPRARSLGSASRGVRSPRLVAAELFQARPAVYGVPVRLDERSQLDLRHLIPVAHATNVVRIVPNQPCPVTQGPQVGGCQPIPAGPPYCSWSAGPP